jgi:hypothetical protein
MFSWMPRRSLLLLIFWGGWLFAQNDGGELRLRITDASGLGLKCRVELTNAANQVHAIFTTDEGGALAIHRLPLGTYSLRVSHRGFADLGKSVEIRSAVPTEVTAALAVASPNTSVTVTDQDTLIEPHLASNVERLGRETIEGREGAQPGRSLQELVNAEPGWLYEGSAVLHPRGSEYQTQLVVDGVPLDDNRSPGLGPAIEVEDIQSVSVYTAGFPAEYGRKLGGVIEINTVRDSTPGLHGTLDLSGGSFNTRDAYGQVLYGWGANTFSVSANGGATEWYLNPPVLQNYTNRGTIGDFSVHYERDLSVNDRMGLSVRHEQSRFEVPNEQVQQAAGQRQDRGNDETIGLLTYQHVFGPNLLGDLRFMARILDADLSSNSAATPIIAGQSRGLDEQYAKGSVSYHHGAHEWKAGVEADFREIDEQFHYQITDPTQFDPGTPAVFQFAGASPDREQALFAQDTIHLGAWTASLGVRWDHYRLLVRQNAVSPRIGIARYFKPLGLVLHASYDRVFQTPAMENLLLSSSPQVAALNPEVLRLPVKPSLANYFEVGFTKEVASVLRAEVNYFRRSANNFSDDDLLLNTTVSFPITFRKATIYGAEAKLDLPAWHRLSGTASYSYMVGTAYLPVTGGLFLGTDATNALGQTSGRFPISQDQRNTLRVRGRYQFTARISASLGANYGSGLPVEFNGTPVDALAQYGQSILDRVDFAKGRVRPNLSVDVSGAAELWKHEKKSVRLQVGVENLNNRLNLINFAGLFSGNAVAMPRSYDGRLSLSF